jgi:MFS family permease
MKTLQRLVAKFNLSGFPPAIWAVTGMNCVGGIGWATSFTYISLYLYQERNIPMTQVGLLMLISGISAGMCQILAGFAGDRFGHRRTALLFSLGMVIASIALAVFIQLKTPTWSVVLAAIFVATFGSGTQPPLNAIIARFSRQSDLTESYGLQAIAANIGWAIGPLLGGWLLGFSTFGWLFGIGAGIKALSLLGIPFLPPDSPAGDLKKAVSYNIKSLIPAPTLMLFGLLAMLFYLTMTQWAGTLSVFTVDRLGFSTAQYGLLMSISGVLIIVFQYPISHAMTRYGRKALILGCLFYAAGFLSLAWIKSFMPAVGSIVIMVTGEMLFVPSSMAVVGQMSGPDDKGKSMGFYGLCSTMGFSLGPLLGGFLLDKYPQTPLFLWGPIALCSFIAAFGFTIWRGYTRESTSADAKSSLTN